MPQLVECTLYVKGDDTYFTNFVKDVIPHLGHDSEKDQADPDMGTGHPSDLRRPNYTRISPKTLGMTPNGLDPDLTPAPPLPQPRSNPPARVQLMSVSPETHQDSHFLRDASG
ncbi:hypothetical protein SKAU_G00282960 [Synaphobranchus kaupii]|uniref:Uncharacterized protein n=1 Tax=Synaphobranchus kaupii TaxID=118154 RepID=A0A9Q1EXI1_SYNKA|nr:hypothetical protein SKAU_G00282960 [Synaphobranchus kaupii]